MAVTKINGATQIKDASIGNTQIASDAAIATSKLADSANFILRGGSVAFTADQSLGGNKLTNVGTPSASTDAATKGYVDTVANGLDWKNSVRVATTEALPANTRSGNVLTADANGSINGTGIDSVTDLALNDRVLVKNEATGANNGLYYVSAVGDGSNPWTLTRTTDADADAEVTGGLSVFINEGTTLANTQWALTTNDAITLNTTALTFSQVGGSTSYTAGTGLDLTGNEFSVEFGTSGTTVCVGNDSRLSDARTPVGTSLTSAQIWVGNGSNQAAAVAMSGDATISNTGAVTVSGSTVVKTANYVVRETPSGTVNGSNAEFTLAATPVSGTEHVYLNGLLQEPGSGNDYTISGGTITFETAPVSGDKIRVSYLK